VTASFDVLLDSCSAEIRALAWAAREKLLAAFPGAEETVWPGWGAAAYGHPGDAGAGVAGLSPYRRHVNMYFYQGVDLPDPHGLLQGSGKRMRHVKLVAPGDLAVPGLDDLLAAAWARGAVRTAAAASVLDRVREICLALPETTEVMAHGHPTYKVGTKSFVTFGSYMGLAMRVGADLQEALLADRPAFFKTPYMGHLGWVSLPVEPPPDLAMAADLIVHSYRLAANKRQLAALAGRAR